MNSIEKSKAEEITKLHSEIAGHLRTSLEKAIKIGELLAEQKESLKHGEFTPWVKKHLPLYRPDSQKLHEVTPGKGPVENGNCFRLDIGISPDSWFKDYGYI